MKMSHFVNLLNGMTDIKAYYRKVPVGTQLPFLVWYINDTENFTADNTVYREQGTVYVDLYTQTKDFVRERELEKIFKDNQLVWDSTEVTLGTEATLVNSYQVWMQIDKS